MNRLYTGSRSRINHKLCWSGLCATDKSESRLCCDKPILYLASWFRIMLLNKEKIRWLMERANALRICCCQTFLLLSFAKQSINLAIVEYKAFGRGKSVWLDRSAVKNIVKNKIIELLRGPKIVLIKHLLFLVMLLEIIIAWLELSTHQH